MPKKKAVGVPDLDAYLGKNRRTLCSYEEGAMMHGLRFYSLARPKIPNLQETVTVWRN